LAYKSSGYYGYFGNLAVAVAIAGAHSTYVASSVCGIETEKHQHWLVDEYLAALTELTFSILACLGVISLLIYDAGNCGNCNDDYDFNSIRADFVRKKLGSD
jgi:hypothetical protein